MLGFGLNLNYNPRQIKFPKSNSLPSSVSVLHILSVDLFHSQHLSLATDFTGDRHDPAPPARSSTDLEAVTRGGHSFSLGSRFKPPKGLRDAERYAASISQRGHLVTCCSYSTAALDFGSTPVCPLSLSTCLLSAKFETGIPITETPLRKKVGPFGGGGGWGSGVGVGGGGWDPRR